jgi:hypothetical protein
MVWASSGGAPALVLSATAMVKPKGPSPRVGSPQRWWQRWGGDMGLRSDGGEGKVVKGVLLRSLHSGESPSVHEEASLIHPSTKSNFDQEFIVDFSPIRSIGESFFPF